MMRTMQLEVLRGCTAKRPMLPESVRKTPPTGAWIMIWNLKNNDATWTAENSSMLQTNENAPKEFLDLGRYTTRARLIIR